VAAGVHEEPKYSAVQLAELVGQPAFAGLMTALLALAAACIGRMTFRGGELLLAAQARPSNPRLRDVLLPAVTAACMGCFTNIGLKALGVLLRRSAPLPQLLACCAACAAPALAQLNYLNRGLQLYPQTVFIPVYNSLLVLLETTSGSIFYREYPAILADVRWTSLFALGFGAVVVGIALFALRREAPAVKRLALASPPATGCHGPGAPRKPPQRGAPASRGEGRPS